MESGPHPRVGMLTFNYSVIARAQIEVAKRERCIAVSHGCTGLKLNLYPVRNMLIVAIDRQRKR